jgi:hypothetical protein
MNPVHTLLPDLFKIHHSVLPSMPRSSEWSLPFMFSNQNFVQDEVGSTVTTQTRFTSAMNLRENPQIRKLSSLHCNLETLRPVYPQGRKFLNSLDRRVEDTQERRSGHGRKKPALAGKRTPVAQPIGSPFIDCTIPDHHINIVWAKTACVNTAADAQ